jgi:hypothetical protein
MDDESKFYALLGRAVIDPDFRDRILDTERQADALVEVGIEPSDEVLGELNGSIAAIKSLASHEAFGPIQAVT